MKDLNIINKFLTIGFLGISLYLCNNDVLIYLVLIILITCLFNVKKFLLAILVIFVIVGKISNLEILNINKIYYLILMIGIVTLVIKSFTISQKQYIFDKTIYKWKDLKLTKKHLYNCYYDKCFNRNIDAIKKYDNSKYLLNQVDIKTKRDLSDIYVLHRIRFYQIYSKKKVIFPDCWKKQDTLYLLALIIIFIIILYFR